METKVCKKCGTEKIITEYYINTRWRIGTCKKCKDMYMKEYWLNNRDKKSAYDKKWRMFNHETKASSDKNWKLNNKEKVAERDRISSKISRLKSPEKVKARSLFIKFFYKEKMIRGCCEYFGGKCSGRIEAHHDNYDKPLDIRWFCVKHHRLVDKVFKFIREKQIILSQKEISS